MRCEASRARMLEADGRSLAGEGDAPLAEHVRTCARCRALAERLLAHQRLLAERLDAAAVGPDEATERAILDRVRRRRVWWVPALAAAALVGILLRPEPPPPRPVATPVGEVFHVAPARGHDVAVFETDNPKIKVIWFL